MLSTTFIACLACPAYVAIESAMEMLLTLLILGTGFKLGPRILVRIFFNNITINTPCQNTPQNTNELQWNNINLNKFPIFNSTDLSLNYVMTNYFLINLVQCAVYSSKEKKVCLLMKLLWLHSNEQLDCIIC